MKDQLDLPFERPVSVSRDQDRIQGHEPQIEIDQAQIIDLSDRRLKLHVNAAYHRIAVMGFKQR